MRDKIYSVMLTDKNDLYVIDATTGVKLNKINYSGDIVSGPFIVGDRCTITTNKNNQMRGFVYHLPKVSPANSWSV